MLRALRKFFDAGLHLRRGERLVQRDSIGVSSDTTRVMDLSYLDQVEFLKGPSALMSGIMAVGGSVNYVNKQPTSGPIQNELDLSADTLGTLRSHYGSGGSPGIEGLDYRFDAVGSQIGSFIDGDYRDLAAFATQFNYHVNPRSLCLGP